MKFKKFFRCTLKTKMPEQPKTDHFSQERDVLQEVPENEWSNLCEIYKSNWPNNLYTYYYLHNCIRWKNQEPDFSIKIYSFNGDYSDGTFVADTILGGQPYINMDTPDPNSVRLKEALLKTKLIDWSKGHMFCGIHEKQRHVVMSLAKAFSLPIQFELLSGFHWISKETLKDEDVICPADVYIAKLKEDQVPLLDSLWPHRYEGSVDFLKQLVRLNGGLGIFLKSDDSICSWIMKNQFSGLGVLYTLEQYRNRGYAKLATRALIKEMATDELDVHACIMRENYKSLKLFRDIGFSHISDIFWLQFDKS